METTLLKTLIAAAATTVALAAGTMTPAAAQQDDFCYNYANAQLANAIRGQQKKCAGYNYTMDWNVHIDWCRAQRRDHVIRTLEEQGAKLDGCLTSGPAPTTRPPAAPVAQAPRPPLAGKSFYLNTEGADVPSLCIDIAGGQLREGTPIQLWQCHQQAAQRFGVIGPGRVYAMMAQQLCVDGDERQQLRLVNCQTMRRQWRVEARTNTIRSNDGLCWDVSGGNVPANLRQRQPIIAYRCHNGINQQFVLND
jgi:hypothetical protein